MEFMSRLKANYGRGTIEYDTAAMMSHFMDSVHYIKNNYEKHMKRPTKILMNPETKDVLDRAGSMIGSPYHSLKLEKTGVDTVFGLEFTMVSTFELGWFMVV